MTPEQRAVLSAFKRDLPLIMEGKDPHLYPQDLSGWAIASLTLKHLAGLVADYFEITPAELAGSQTSREFARPRQVFCYLASRHTTKSLPQIGNFLNRDHTTVMHAKKVIADMILPGSQRHDTKLALAVRELEERLK